MKNNKLKEVIAKDMAKQKKTAMVYKTAEDAAKNIDWTKVHKGISWEGGHCELKLNSDGTIYVNCPDEQRDFPPECVVEGMDLYDDDGNLISKWEDYD